jgi:mannose-6-phosphate isomerase-like protein (cupin superfamily)
MMRIGMRATMHESESLIDLLQRARELSGAYDNVVLSHINDHVVRMSRMTRPYYWHLHPNSDETFLGVEGIVVIELREHRIELAPGQLFTVPRETPHRTAPAGLYSVNLTMERADMETVRINSDAM